MVFPIDFWMQSKMLSLPLTIIILPFPDFVKFCGPVPTGQISMLEVLLVGLELAFS